MKRVAGSSVPTKPSQPKKSKPGSVSTAGHVQKTKTTTPTTSLAVVAAPVVAKEEEAMETKDVQRTPTPSPTLSSFLLNGFPSAIPFIVQDSAAAGGTDGAFRISSEARQFLSHEAVRWKRVRVACVVGGYRQGKSALLSFLVRRGLALPVDSVPTSIFGVGNTNRAKTKGLWLSTVVTPMSDDSILLWIDTEGMNSIDANATNDARIFCIAMLAASLLVYNAHGSIEKRSIEELVMATSICRSVKLQAAATGTDDGRTEDGNSDFMPDFMWLARDAHVAIVDRNGQACSANDWLAEALQDQDKELCFRKRSCYRLVRPCTDEAQLHQLETLPLSATRPEFQQQFEDLYQHIRNTIPIKSVAGVQITAAALVELMDGYLQAINTGAAPVVMSQVAMLTEIYCRQAYDDALKAFTESLKTATGKSALFKPEWLLHEFQQTWLPAAVETYRKAAFGSSTPVYLERLQQTMGKHIGDVQATNRERVQQQLTTLKGGLASAHFADVQSLQAAHDSASQHFTEQVGSSDDMRLLWAHHIQSDLLKWAAGAEKAMRTQLSETHMQLEQQTQKHTELQRLHDQAVSQHTEHIETLQNEMAKLQADTEHQLSQTKHTHQAQLEKTEALLVEAQNLLLQQRQQADAELAIQRQATLEQTQKTAEAVAKVHSQEANLKKEREALQHAENTLREQQTELTSLRVSQHTRIPELQAQLQDCEQKWLGAQSALDAARLLFTEQVQSLQTQGAARLQEVQRLLDDCQKQLVIQQKESETKLSSATLALSALQDKHSSSEASLHQALERLSWLTTESDRSRAALEKQLAASRHEVKEQNDRIFKQMTSYHERLAESSAREVAQARDTATLIAQLQTQVEKLTAERNDTKRQLEEQAAQQLEATSLRDQRDKLLAESREASQRADLLVQQLQDRKREIDSQRSRVHALETQCIDAQTRAMQAQSSLSNWMLHSPPVMPPKVSAVETTADRASASEGSVFGFSLPIV